MTGMALTKKELEWLHNHLRLFVMNERKLRQHDEAMASAIIEHLQYLIKRERDRAANDPLGEWARNLAAQYSKMFPTKNKELTND